MINLIIGIIGMILILMAFILDEFVDKFNQNTLQYNLTNILGSGLLTYYAYTLNSVPFIILNIAWFLAAGYKLIRIVRK
jgi:hypothetical protein